MTESLRRDAERIVETLRAAGHEAYFAGGCVRDMVMGVEPHDYDIATSARPEEVVRLFPGSLTVGAQFGVVVVLAGSGDFEVATFRADAPSSDGRHPDSVRFCSAREDVARRDFTINGMLYDPVAQRVIDWVEGQEDVRRRVIRAIGNPEERFAEDKLRLLRAVRFAARLDYAIEEKTYAAMVRMAPHAGEVSAERIRDELVRILTGPNAGRAVRLMHDTGLLKPVLPEIEALAGVEQPPQFHPEGDVLEHTCVHARCDAQSLAGTGDGGPPARRWQAADSDLRRAHPVRRPRPGRRGNRAGDLPPPAVLQRPARADRLARRQPHAFHGRPADEAQHAQAPPGPEPVRRTPRTPSFGLHRQPW